MNAGRRICCNAANAFRPGLALRNVFHDTTSQRYASQASAKHRKRPDASILYKDVFNQGRRPDQGPGTGRPKKEIASNPRNTHIATEQNVEATTELAEDLGKVLENDEGIEEEEQLNIDTPAVYLDGLYLDNAAGGEAVSANEAIHEKQPPTPAKSSYVGEITQATNAAQSSLEYQSPKLAEIAAKKVANKEKDVLEYEGHYVQPVTGPWQRAIRLPWLSGLNCNNREIAATKRLGQEIDAFVEWIRPTEAETTARETVIKKTMNVVTRNTKGFSIEPFGSSRSGLALASSDVDLRISQNVDVEEDSTSWLPKGRVPLPPRGLVRRANLRILSDLQKVFWAHPDYVLCNIRHARYPLLHMQHKPSGIDVQIVCANDTSEQREYIRGLLLERPEIYKLYAILKTALDTRGLTDVYRGGLGSYAILIMIVAALNKQHYDDVFSARRTARRVIVGDTQAEDKLANHLLQVTQFWAYFNSYDSAVVADPVDILRKLDPDTGMEINPVANGRSLNAKKHAKKKSAYSQLRLLDQAQPYLLCLIDPRDSTNDLGRQAYGWKHIQATMQQFFSGLKSKTYDNYRHDIPSFLGPVVGTAPKEYRLRRTQMHGYARALKPEDVFKDTPVGEDGSGKMTLMKSGRRTSYTKDASRLEDAQARQEGSSFRDTGRGVAMRSIFFDTKEEALSADPTTTTPWELAKFTTVAGVPHKKGELRASKALELKLRNEAKLEIEAEIVEAHVADTASYGEGTPKERKEDAQDAAAQPACVTLPKLVEQESVSMKEQGKAIATAS